ncbi:hypothetical protein [Streptodolium elevatio]|uniref:Uncharacterized protein n=1 Tax=Streptodolium elevatio TaxID=3157996 RepID=A0ABV3DIZ9_9ACTN
MTSTKTGAGAGTARRVGHAASPASVHAATTVRPARSDDPAPPEARVPAPASEPTDAALAAPGIPADLRSTPDLARPHRRTRPPRVRLRLPDGQHLDVTLVSWHQYGDGTWRARVSWPVWGAVAHAGEVQTRTCAQEAYVPARMLTPLPDEDYRAVRRHRPRISFPRQA